MINLLLAISAFLIAGALIFMGLTRYRIFVQYKRLREELIKAAIKELVLLDMSHSLRILEKDFPSEVVSKVKFSVGATSEEDIQKQSQERIRSIITEWEKISKIKNEWGF